MSSAEPVLRVSVTPEGSTKTSLDLSESCLGIVYEDLEHAADKLQIRVENNDLRNFDDPVWRKGNFVDVSWGYPGAMSPVRRCHIRKVKGFQTLTVEAHGLEVLLNVVQRTRIFEGMRRSDVARQIAAEWGYAESQNTHIEDTEVVLGVVAQARLTDAQMMRRLAHKEGFVWFIDWDGFHFHSRNLAQRALRVVEWDGAAGEVLDVVVDNDVTGKPGQVRLRGRDPLKRRTIDVSASHETDTSRTVAGKVVEAPGPDSPKVPGFVSIAQGAVRHTTEKDPAAALRAAKGQFRRAQQVAVKMSISMIGDPALNAKSVIDFRCSSKRLSQPYYVRTVKHTVGSGYVVSLGVVSDGSGGHSTKSELAVEAVAIQVGPKVAGKRGPATVRRTIDVDSGPSPLQSIPAGVDDYGRPITTHAPRGGREAR